MRIRKRSICDSGSGKVPIWNEGFWVATMKNGSGSACVSPSIVTWRSSIASSSALCALGVARLTSSAMHELREHRPAMELEATARAVVDRDADDVGRQQVARELDALVREAEHARERVRERRLADARDVLDQEVAAREQAGEREPDLARPCRA